MDVVDKQAKREHGNQLVGDRDAVGAKALLGGVLRVVASTGFLKTIAGL